MENIITKQFKHICTKTRHVFRDMLIPYSYTLYSPFLLTLNNQNNYKLGNRTRRLICDTTAETNIFFSEQCEANIYTW